MNPVHRVEYILALHRPLQKARTGHEQTALKRQIETTDRQIDSLVYYLYGRVAQVLEPGRRSRKRLTG